MSTAPDKSKTKADPKAEKADAKDLCELYLRSK